MNINEAVKILSKHNSWRRCNEDMEMVEPAVLGKAIEKIVDDFILLKLLEIDIRTTLLGAKYELVLAKEYLNNSDIESACKKINQAIKEMHEIGKNSIEKK